jgi:hypothetical protein
MVVAVVVAACTASQPQGPDPTTTEGSAASAAVVTVRVQPARVALQPGQTLTFTATAYDEAGDTLAASLVWGASGGSVNSDGVYTAPDGAGTFEVVARAGSGATDSARVEVSSPPVASAPVVQNRFERLARGVNLTYWFSMGVWRPDYMSEADLVQLRQLGFTFVRLPILPGVIFDETEPGRLGPRIGELDRAVQLILDAGLAVVVDLHPEDDQFRTRLQSDDGFVAAVAAFWKSLASNLSSYDPDSVFLEVLNEPQFSDANRWNQVARTLVAAVRQGAPAHTIVLSGPGCCQAEGLAGLTPLSDANVIYTVHYYMPAAFTHQGADWIAGSAYGGLHDLPYPSSPEACADVLPTIPDASLSLAQNYCEARWDSAKVQGDIDRIANWSRSHGDVPVLVGEFGVYRAVVPARDRGHYLEDTRRALERDGLGWAMWDYAGGFGMMNVDSAGRSLDSLTASGLGLKGY